MKYYFLQVLIMSIFITCHAQSSKPTFSYENFEKEIIVYEPIQHEVSDKDFKYGLFVLNETKKAVKNDVEGFNRADYFNILSSFLSLNENKENIHLAFEKFKNSKGSCEYFSSSVFFKSSKFDLIRDDIEKQISLCQSSNANGSNKIDLKKYSKKNSLDYKLVALIAQISELDKKYRDDEKIDWSKQTPIDLKNQRIIDSLYKSHKKYIGTSLVGEKLSSVMWAVIQHSNLEMMEKFLPKIQKAVQEKEIDSTPFKMLIDRIYSQKENYQIFGSQAGVKLASKKIRKKVILKYKVE